MTAYAVAHLQDVQMGPQIVEYIERIDATLEPFGGRFLVHGGAKQVIEGAWPGDLIIIQFPGREALLAWYASPEYQAILPLRTENSRGDVIIAEGVPDGYRATQVLKG